MMIRAIVMKQIMWPQRGEDRDEGGFEILSIKPVADADGDSSESSPA
jgi:hypothetical protein